MKVVRSQKLPHVHCEVEIAASPQFSVVCKCALNFIMECRVTKITYYERASGVTMRLLQIPSFITYLANSCHYCSMQVSDLCLIFKLGTILWRDTVAHGNISPLTSLKELVFGP